MKTFRQLLATPIVCLAFGLLYVGCFIANGMEGVEKCKRKLA